MSLCEVCGQPAQPPFDDRCAEHGEQASTRQAALADLDLSAQTAQARLEDLGAKELTTKGADPLQTRVYPKGGLLGRVLGGRFELKEFLGSGGFGATYTALDQRFRRECVVKLLHPQGNPPGKRELEMRQRFNNEAVAMAHLLHPHIVQAFDSGEETDGTCWIAMEYAQGRSLGEVLKGEKQQPTQRVANLGAQIAGALAFAHARGIVHRDLKPDNVILVDGATGGEVVKVLDFGIARIIDPGMLGLGAGEANLTQAGTFFGTPAYMSPEQAGGEQVGPESDVYSLGVLLYRMLTGVLPGQVPAAWNPATTISYVMSLPEPVRRLRPDCPPLLAELVHLMLVKEPRQRTLSAAQVQSELQSLHPTMSGVRAQPLPVAPRGKGLLVGGAIGLLAVGGVVAALVLKPAAAPAPSAAAVAPVPSAEEMRDLEIADVLHRARSGEAAERIDKAALDLARGGADARLLLARGIAHKLAKDYAVAQTLLKDAQTLAPATGVGLEAGALAQECSALEQAASAPAAAPAAAPVVKAAAAPAAKPAGKPKHEDYPEY